ncbi:uncharacterized protein LOC129953695 [Eupeodes corollae]|uniref:uncharacterized protein LOC129953695 n=1 Tax=Eupeodes corollae TaxID=290404 RepID=UPI0024924C91|nr:uncharacterized protein LOC129953695 [Eupeodes corollae]XP_055923011.1 uncharacterized protein LOC129953695 [Eupeodes corollae]XP_055923012.1 uncharacterized protein LOC129953695 [Eupeodes corollae]
MYSQILVYFGILLVIITSNSYASVQVNHQSQHDVTNDIPSVDKMDQLPIPKDQTLIVRLPSNTLLKYTAYKDVSILHFRIPPDSKTAYFTFKALEESKSAFHRVCKPRDVTLHLKAGSYPVISPENITFPRNFLNADQRFKIYDLQFKSDGKQQRITVEGPQMGNWFAVAFLSWTDPNNDRIEQQGLAASCETLLLAEMSVSRFIPIILNSGQVHNGTLTSTDLNNATSTSGTASASALTNATFTNQAALNRPNTTTSSSSSTPSNEPQQPTSSSPPTTTTTTRSAAAATMTTTATATTSTTSSSSSAFTSSSSSTTTTNATIATNSEIIYKFYVPENVGVATARITIGNGCLTCPDVGFYIQANALPTDTNYIQSTIIKPNQTGEISIEFYVHSSAWHFIRLRFEQFQEPSAASMSAAASASGESAGSVVSEGTPSTASVYPASAAAAASSVSRSSRASSSMHLEGFTDNQRIQHLYAIDEYQRWVDSASGMASTVNPDSADDDVSGHTTSNTTWYEMEYSLQIDFHNLATEDDEETDGGGGGGGSEAGSVPWKPIIYRDMEFYPLLRQTYREFFMFDYDLIPDSNGTVPLVLNLTAGTPAGFSFEVGDVYDIGGTLSFAVSMKHGLKGLDLKGTPLPSTERSGILAEKLIGRPPVGKDSDDKEEDDQALPRSNQTIIVCMRMGEPGEPTWPDKCRYGRKVLPASSIVNNTDSNTSTGLIHVPFPESGQWYVTMGLYCHGAETAARVTIIDSVKEFVKKYVGMLETMRPPCACAHAAKYYQTCINDRKCVAQMNETETLKIKECMMDSKCSDDFVDMTKKFESHHKFATEQHFALDNCNTSVVFTISSSPCVAGRCGRFGRCYHYMSGGFVFSTCVCMKGYRGWDCTEDAQVPSSISILVASLLLTLSNLLFIPSIYMGVRRKYYTESVIYFFAMFFSTFYHACDSGEDEYSFCLVKIGVLQFCDFYCGLLAIWVTLVAMAHIRPQFVSLLHMLGAILLAFGTELNKQSLWVFLAPALTGICIISASWGLRCQKSRKLFPAKKYLSLYMPLGTVLVMVGLVCYAFLQTKQNYHIVHSIWHIVMALSILCLLPSRKSFIPKC